MICLATVAWLRAMDSAFESACVVRSAYAYAWCVVEGVFCGRLRFRLAVSVVFGRVFRRR